jgi:hypothetical protein
MREAHIAERSVFVIVLVTVAGVVVGVASQGLWYGHLNVEQRVSFWVEAAVAYGTLVLAIVTWGSVREAQDVQNGEHLRFRQSRMPMVYGMRAYGESGGVYLRLRNSGDGPAENVLVTFDVEVELTWNDDGTTPSPDRCDHVLARDVSATRELWSSFMPVGEPGEYERLWDAEPPGMWWVGGRASLRFRKLLIEYRDVFGSNYSTTYEGEFGGDTVALRYTWRPPDELLAPR